MSKLAIGSKERSYLQNALRLNPIFESAECLALRRALLGVERVDKVDVTSREERNQQREALRRQIGMVQSEFWRLPLDQLQRSLSALDTRNCPEFAPVVNRLRTAAACRGEFPKLGQMAGMHAGLFNTFKSSVVLPPVDAARVKERFLRSIQDKKQLKEIRKASRLIQKTYPILYALERDWFGTIAKLKLYGSRIDYGQTGQGIVDNFFDTVSQMPWYSWWILFTMLKIAMGAFIR